MMKTYWFYLETYVFIWSNSKEILLYNTLSGKGYLFSKVSELNLIVSQLEDKNNLYCITIIETELQYPAIRNFVHSVRENFCGDLLDKSIYKQKPLIIIPELNINEEIFTGVKTIKRDIESGIHAEKNLLELSVHLTGKCELDCIGCDCMYKQIGWCTKNEKILPKEMVLNLIEQTRYTAISEIRFKGGNIFSYPFWDELINKLKKYSFKKNVYCNSLLLHSNSKKLEIFKDNGFFICVFVDVSNINEQLINGNFPVNQQYKYLFKIKSIEEYEIAQSIIKKHQIKAQIIPYYDHKNLCFFEENIYQSLDDIINTQWQKNEIFAHTVLNTYFFGKFTVLSDGKIYANVNFEPVGNIKSDHIKTLVNQELKNGKSWFLTRNKIKPCCDCLYKYLCPSLSNYETAIGRNNLCNMSR